MSVKIIQGITAIYNVVDSQPESSVKASGSRYSLLDKKIALAILKKLKGNLSAAEKETGISESTLYRWNKDSHKINILKNVDDVCRKPSPPKLVKPKPLRVNNTRGTNKVSAADRHKLLISIVADRPTLIKELVEPLKVTVGTITNDVRFLLSQDKIKNISINPCEKLLVAA